MTGSCYIRVMRAWPAVLLLALTGCFSPQFNDGAFVCGPEATCPEGQSCIAGTCRMSDPSKTSEISLCGNYTCSALNCAPLCQPGCTCNLTCDEAQNCTPTCTGGAECAIECPAAGSCDVSCDAASSCAIACNGSDCHLSCSADS